MLSSNQWSNAIFTKCATADKNAGDCVVIPFDVGKWIIVGCIIFSFLLLAYEGRKAKKIIASRDISYAFTNIMANNYYSFRSYNHFCFFAQIENSTKKKDDFAFFVFFTFKGWKRLLLADGPRQSINALTLYSFWKVNGGGFPDPNKYLSDGSFITACLLLSIVFTTLVFAGSLLLLIVAAIFYVPLLCYIQGNLKEYCCHKVDKRIGELVKRKQKQRMAKQAALAKKEAAGDFSHLKNKKGELIRAPLPEPTLPNINLDDDFQSPSKSQSEWAPDHKSTKSDYPSSLYSAPDYPPMPTYDAYPQYPPNTQHGYSSSQHGFDNPAHHDESEYASTAYLADGAAPPGLHPQHSYSHFNQGSFSGDGHSPAQPRDGYDMAGAGGAQLYAREDPRAESYYSHTPAPQDPYYQQQQQYGGYADPRQHPAPYAAPPQRTGSAAGVHPARGHSFYETGGAPGGGAGGGYPGQAL